MEDELAAEQPGQHFSFRGTPIRHATAPVGASRGMQCDWTRGAFNRALIGQRTYSPSAGRGTDELSENSGLHGMHLVIIVAIVGSE